jgi:hypothetical protein
MKPHRLVYRLWILLLTLLLTGCMISGCNLRITLGESGPTADDTISVLPDPHGDDPMPLDDPQQEARRQESQRYTRDVIYQGGTINAAIQLPSGDIIDGLDRATLPVLPYALPPLPWTAADLVLPPGVEFGVPDFEQYAELADLVTTAAPFERPDFSAYIMGETDATSIEDYLARYQVGGQPSGTEHLYAGLRSQEPNRGVWGYMNQFHPKVEPGSLSLMEFAVGCDAGGDLKEQIGVVISVDKVNGWGWEPRLHVEYARPNPYTGKLEYVWDGRDGQFKANPYRRHRPGEIVDVSVLAGKQVEHLMGIFQEPIRGDWWIFYKDDWLGYYPASLFTMLNDGACASAWYGEVGRRTPASPTDWPNTEMGSGQHGSAGPLLAAYVRTPTYLDITYLFGGPPIDDPLGKTTWMGPSPVECYSRTEFVDGIMYLGGDGGNNPYCFGP